MKWWVCCYLGVAAQAAVVHGAVVDPADAAIRADVYVHGSKQLVARTSAADTGDFKIEIPPGDYLLEVRATAFASAMRHIVVAEGRQEVGRIALDLSGCEYPGTISDYFGTPIPKASVIDVEDVCQALRHAPKDRWVVVVGRRSADGNGIDGNCNELPIVDTLRLPARVTLDVPVQGSFAPIRVRNVEKKLEAVRSRLRSRGESGSIVAAYGYLSVPTNLKTKKCDVACSPDFDVAPAHFIAIEAYRELK
jgi:hypothetical protein